MDGLEAERKRQAAANGPASTVAQSERSHKTDSSQAHKPWTSDEAKATRASVLHKFDLGAYKLNDTISDFTGLVEFSPLEYEAIKRKFKGEKNYNAPPVNFLGRSWRLMLSTVHGKIRKIAALTTLPNEQAATPVAMQAHQYCKERLGSPSEQTTGLVIWDTKDGNVVMQTTEGVDEFGIAIVLTSASVRQLEPL